MFEKQNVLFENKVKQGYRFRTFLNELMML